MTDNKYNCPHCGKEIHRFGLCDKCTEEVLEMTDDIRTINKQEVGAVKERNILDYIVRLKNSGFGKYKALDYLTKFISDGQFGLDELTDSESLPSDARDVVTLELCKIRDELLRTKDAIEREPENAKLLSLHGIHDLLFTINKRIVELDSHDQSPAYRKRAIPSSILKDIQKKRGESSEDRKKLKRLKKKHKRLQKRYKRLKKKYNKLLAEFSVAYGDF